jgi:hypothetical protein
LKPKYPGCKSGGILGFSRPEINIEGLGSNFHAKDNYSSPFVLLEQRKYIAQRYLRLRKYTAKYFFSWIGGILCNIK